MARGIVFDESDESDALDGSDALALHGDACALEEKAPWPWPWHGDEAQTPAQNVVLDIDETMAHTRWDSHDLLDIIDADPDADHVRERLYILHEISRQHQAPLAWGTCRPFLRAFLQYVGVRFRSVIVWTAGTAEYAQAIIPRLFRGVRPPDRVYSREHCMVDAAGGLVKPLHWITTAHQHDKHDRNGDSVDITLRNTFVVDDNPQYVRYNRRNAIVIPRYSPNTLPDVYRCDFALLRLMAFFQDPYVCQADDVRQFDKGHVFNGADSLAGDL